MSRLIALVIALAAVALTGCERMQAPQGALCVNKEKRIARFDECMKLLPYGPDKTVYNDWAEVVETCDDISVSQTTEWKAGGCLK